MKLSDKALLVQLNVSQWTARKYDKRATEQAQALENLKVENDRLKGNNLDLKMQVIELREKLLKILEIVNKK